MAHQSIGAMVHTRIAESPSNPAMRVKAGTGWKDVSWSQLGKRMDAIAAGILTSKAQVEERDAIAIIGNTSEDWVTCDFAALSCGLRTVPVYATLLPEEAGYLHVDTAATLTIVENKDQYEKVVAFRDGFTFFDKQYGTDVIKIRHIVVMDPAGMSPGDDWESLADLEARGREQLESVAQRRKEWGDKPGRHDVATYTYTSGTTGPPKGVIQTNENMISMCESIEQCHLISHEFAEGGLFLFLPLAHSFGRLIELAGPYFDAPLVISTIPTLVDDLTSAKPAFFPSAPRVYEKMKSKIEGRVAGAPPIRKALFNWAMNTGKATIPYRSKGEPIPFLLKTQLGLADKLVLSKLRAALGFDRAKILVSGSAPLNVEVHEFFFSLQVDLLEAYGLTETCPGLTTNLPGNFRLGTVGKAFPGVEIKIASDGEILAKGTNITSGYLNRDDATSEAFDDEGWFHTGDLGSMDGDGFVKITGRKKELMKTSGGKYIAPAKLEGRLKNHPLVQEAVTIADTRNYVTTLLAIDPEELEVWAQQNNAPNDPNCAEVNAELQKHVDAVNETLAKYETVKYFTVVPPLTVEDGLLTASLKVKRKPTYERYADEIEAMYQKKK